LADGAVAAPSAPAEILSKVGFDQHIDEAIPGDLVFRDEQDRQVTFGELHRDKPIVLALSYFACETLCPLVRQGVVNALRPLGFTVGKDFDVVFVTIDPMDTAATSQAVKQTTVHDYGRAGSENGFHFLRSDPKTIGRLADAIGFRYAYDEAQKMYAHPAGIVLVTPEGRIARYFFGVEYATQDLRLGLVETSQNKIGSPVDQLLLLCYHYDPTAGKYSLLIIDVMRWAGGLTVGLIGLFIFVMWRKESHRALPLG
jgi:protein SCO1/2